MKSLYALALVAGLAVAGCATHYDRYGNARFSTPSWGASSDVELNTPGTPVEIDVAPPVTGQTEMMTPSAGQSHGTEPQMPPTYSDDSTLTDPPMEAPSFGPQRR